MKEKVLLFTMATVFFWAACGGGAPAEEAPGREELSAEIQALEAGFQQQARQETVDTAAARSMIEKAEQFARLFPQDTLAPQFLFQAANICRGLGDFSTAVELWGRIASEYEQYRRAPESLFFQAFTLENDLRDTARARAGYEEFLKKYPKHPIARDVSLLLEALHSGKSAEDMVREFQKEPR